VIEIVRAVGACTVQDLGRPGFMHMGVPPGGALAPALLARANAAVGNEADAAAIEVAGALTLRASVDVVIALDDGAARTLEADHTLDVDGAARVRYVAVRGGIDVPRVLGGRGTLLVARLGGFRGRVLARGDVLSIATATASATARAGEPSAEAASAVAPVRVVPGPDRARFEGGVDTLLSTTWHLSARRDRVGARLEGGRIRRIDHGASESMPMVRGAIQVPPSGEPIVLGPDHPTTGGYPVVAVVLAADVDAFYARPVGATIAFMLSRV
jgi:biotin-dependent carboxylase-like uncharacterized protein